MMAPLVPTDPVSFALYLAFILAQHAPHIVEAIRQGRIDEIDWPKNLPRPKEELQEEVHKSRGVVR